MNLEIGDKFIVTRGFELGDSDSFTEVIAMITGEGENWKSPQKEEKEKEPRYDRSYAGCVFECLAIADSVVCARVIMVDCSHNYKRDYINKPFMLNLKEIEVFTVGQEFLDALKI